MAPISPTIDFSAVVVCYNEADRLEQALDTISFCKELIIVDLGSTDRTLDIARQYGAVVMTHERPAYPNLPRQFGIKHAAHSWIVAIDPDEEFPAEELPKIETVIRDRPDLAGIRMPWQFYFGRKELRCTTWGNPNNKKIAIVHRDRIDTTPFVHQEYKLGPNIHAFQPSEIKPIKHYWLRNYRDLIHKHRRYLCHEGQKRYAAGGRFTWSFFFRQTLRALRMDLFRFRGITGGFVGIALSLFRAWYTVMSLLGLRRYQKKQSD